MSEVWTHSSLDGSIRTSLLLGGALELVWENWPPSLCVEAVDVVPPYFGKSSVGPWERVEIAPVLVAGSFNWNADGRLKPHEAASGQPDVFAFAGIGAFIDDDGKISKISSNKNADEIARIDNPDKIGGHFSQPAPLVYFPKRGIYSEKIAMARALSCLSAHDAPEVPHAYDWCPTRLMIDVKTESVVGQGVVFSELDGQRSHKASAIDMGERIGLTGNGSPAGTTRRSHGLYLDLHPKRAIRVFIHSLTKKMGKVGFRDQLFGHGSSPPKEELSSVTELRGNLSSIGKKIINFSQLFLNLRCRGDDYVGLLAILRKRNNAPIGLKARVGDLSDTNGFDRLASRGGADFLQDDQFEILGRYELLCHASAPVRVATRALLHSVLLCASGNPVLANKNRSIVPFIGRGVISKVVSFLPHYARGVPC